MLKVREVGSQNAALCFGSNFDRSFIQLSGSDKFEYDGLETHSTITVFPLRHGYGIWRTNAGKDSAVR